MVFKSIIGATCTCLTALSFNAHAVVINTLNGVDYEWLELTETAGMSRDYVEAQLSDVNSTLYGYQYASRALVESLILSYATFDGIDGWHGDNVVIAGQDKFITDFGVTEEDIGDDINSSLTTVDGYTVLYDGFRRTLGWFGTSGECGGLTTTCIHNATVYYDVQGQNQMTLQLGNHGWNSSHIAPVTVGTNESLFDVGSFLYSATVVPVPPAIWLFGSGLLGLIGLARRKSV